MNISIIGAGYVGLVTGACFSKLGHQVTCIDQDSNRVNMINSGQAPFFEPNLDELVKGGAQSGNLVASHSLKKSVLETDITFIAVGTPTTDGAIDLSQVINATRELGIALRNKPGTHIIVVKSTVLPGTTEGSVQGALTTTNPRNDTIHVAANPEFLRQGTAVEDFLKPDRIVIGASSTETGARVMALYDKIEAPKLLTTAANAELIKYATNALLATNISFSNEIANICENTVGADVNIVMKGLHLDKRFSHSQGGQIQYAGIVNYLRAGCGFGGSCLPKDLQALRQYAEEKNVSARLLKAVNDTNENRPLWLFSRVQERLGQLSNRSILLVGVAFKPGTDDLRNSPALIILDALVPTGANTMFWDPHVKEKQLPPETKIPKVDDITEGIRDCDAIIITSDFKELENLDWHDALRGSSCSAIIDGRGLLANVDFPDRVSYDTIGRKP